MRRFPNWVVRTALSLTGLLWLAPVTAGATSIALLPLQDRTGDRQAIAAVDQHLMSRLLNLGGIVNPGEVRDSLRQLRVRRVDTVSPDTLRRVGRGVQADWLISVTLHEANSEDVPRLTLSARAYLTETGELFWAGFQSGSGLGPRTVLGLKEIRTVDSLAGWVVTRLVEDLEKGSQDLESKGHSRETAQAQKLGRVAVVPLGGLTQRWGTANAETVTEALRAIAYRHGLQLVSPNDVSGTLQRQAAIQWGGVPVPVREELQMRNGADSILTGAVEAFEINNSPDGPRPRISLSLRLVDARSGRLLWAGGLERDVADHPGFFGKRRIYSLGALTEQVVETLTRRLLQESSSTSLDRG